MLRFFERFAVIAACLLLLSRPAVAQVVTSSVHLGDIPIPNAGADPADKLSQLVDRGTSAELVTYLQTLVTAISATFPASSKGMVRFVWAGETPDGKPATRHVLYHPGDTAPTSTLRGIGPNPANVPADFQCFDVLVTSFEDGRGPILLSLYTSTEADNPVLAQLPDVVNKMGGLEAVAAAGATSNRRRPIVAPGGARRATVLTGPMLRVYGIGLPFKRADVAVRDAIVDPVSGTALAAGSTKLKTKVGLTAGRVSSCANALAAAYDTAIRTASEGEGKCASIADPASDEADACRKALTTTLDARRKTVLAACVPDTGSIGSDPVADVNGAFRDYVDALGGATVEGTDALKNTPLDRVSFGLMTAVRFGPTSFAATRVKVGDDGLVQEDPQPRLVNAVMVNWHPGGLDPNHFTPWRDPGSLTVSAGTTIAPDFGVVIAAGYSPIRGLSINVGYALFLINAPRDTVVVGEAVPEALKADPFRTSHAGSLIWGLMYSFK